MPSIFNEKKNRNKLFVLKDSSHNQTIAIHKWPQTAWYFRFLRRHIGFLDGGVPPISIAFCSPNIFRTSGRSNLKNVKTQKIITICMCGSLSRPSLIRMSVKDRIGTCTSVTGPWVQNSFILWTFLVSVSGERRSSCSDSTGRPVQITSASCSGLGLTLRCWRSLSLWCWYVVVVKPVQSGFIISILLTQQVWRSAVLSRVQAIFPLS